MKVACHLLRWAPWAGLAALAALYAGELVREMVAGYFPPEALPRQLAFAAVALLPLVPVVVVVRQDAERGALGPRARGLLLWVPRIGLLLFVAFLSLFALDVFGAGYGFWQTAWALLMHLLPSFALLAAAVVAWRWAWVGAAAMFAWAALYLAIFWGRFPPSVYALLAGLPIVLGVLSLLAWRHRAELHLTS